jgi:quercetin dioxygenase-like cupin family protein
MSEEDEDMDEAALSLLAETLPAVPVPSEARARLFAQIDGPLRFAPFAEEIAARFGAPVAVVRAALARIDDPSAWLKSPTSSLSLMPVHLTSTGAVVISRLAAGTRIPKHKHAVREVTYVLDGVLISDDRAHGRAACLDMPPGSEHALQVSEDEECLVVFASPPPA